MTPRQISRILLIAPRLGGETPGREDADPYLDGELCAIAESLRAGGYQAEVCGVAAAGGGAGSIEARIEHSWPHVVVCMDGSSSGPRCGDVLSAAKRVVPGVVTVAVSASADTPASGVSAEPAADFTVCADRPDSVTELLRLLRAGGPVSSRWRLRLVRRARPRPSGLRTPVRSGC